MRLFVILARSTCAKRRILKNFPLPCGEGLRGWVIFALDFACRFCEMSANRRICITLRHCEILRILQNLMCSRRIRSHFVIARHEVPKQSKILRFAESNKQNGENIADSANQIKIAESKTDMDCHDSALQNLAMTDYFTHPLNPPPQGRGKICSTSAMDM
ncbi:hypothetical protein [Helicobacter sp. 23-1045]